MEGIRQKILEAYNEKAEPSAKLEKKIGDWKKKFIEKYEDKKNSTWLIETWGRFLKQRIQEMLRGENIYSNEGQKEKFGISPQKIHHLFTEEERKQLNMTPCKGTLKDLQTARRFFHREKPNENETLWELYKNRYDPKGDRKMNLGQFYTLLPESWRETYQWTDATYEVCKKADEWFGKNEPIQEETTWDLYKRFDPEGKLKMHQKQFHTLLPYVWRKMKNYQCVDAKYEDCKKADEWFGENEPNQEETTWALYKRFDPDGKRKMHQGQFYTLLPASWRQLKNYKRINATYEDCLKT